MQQAEQGICLSLIHISMFLSFCGKVPRNEGAAFVAPNATVQGDVILKAGSTVWYGACLLYTSRCV